MKPRAMSEWIVSAASSALSPRCSVHARVSFSPAVKNVIRSSVSTSLRTTSPSADSPPPRNSAASSAESSASSASSCRSMPSPPLTSSRSGFVVSGSSSGGSSPSHSASVPPASRCASSRSSSAASALSRASPDLACLTTRSSRRSTWSRSATSSSSRSVSRSSAGTRVPEKPSRTTSSASTCRRLPSSCGPVPGTSTTRTAAGVTFRAATTCARASRRSSGICAIPTCSLPEPCVSARVSARNSVVFPELGSPTIPASRARRLGLLALDLPLQRGERAVLQRLDRALGLVEDRRDLGVRQVEDELQRQHLLLLGGELLDQLQHRLPPDRLHRGELRRRLLLPGRLGHVLLGLPAPPRAEVVHREVVRDPEQPGRERSRLPLEAADLLQHLQERLRRQVLGVVAVADADVEVAVDPVEVDEVQLFERVAVALLAARHERAHVLVGVARRRSLGRARHCRTFTPRSRS